MKKSTLIITALCLIAVSLSAQPQLEKGKLLAGVTSTMALEGSYGSEMFGFGFWKSSYGHGSDPLEAIERGFVYNMLPKAGYFIMDNLAAGLEVFVSGYTSKSIGSSDKYKYGQFGAGPFARYYYPLDNIYPLGEVRCLFGTDKDNSGSPYKKSFMMFGLSAGAAIPLGDMVTFDLLAGYFYALDKRKGDDIEFHGDRHARSGLMINLGFAVYLDESHLKK